jgi:ABC-type sugar transport system substrate-binding protein
LHEALSNGVEVVAEQPADWDRAKAMSVAENIISSGTEFTVAFVNNEDMATGVIQVLDENEMADSIAVVATGGSDDGLALIQDGKLTATMACSPAYEACVAVKAVVDYFNGADVPENIISPIVVVTSENLSEAVSWTADDNMLRLAGLIE